MTRSISLAVLTSLATLVSLPAGAADPTSVDQISATPAASTVTVTGSATFRDVPVQIGTDGSGDAQTAGTDLTKASISAPVANRVRFRLDIADPLPELSSSPAAVYLWPITVDGNNTGLNLHASRARVNTNPTTPHLRVVTIAAGTITTVANVNGTMAGGIVEWDVPMSTIDAQAGSVVTTEGLITVIPGISGVGTLNGANFDDMFAEDPYTVPSRTVLLGMGAAGDPDGAISLNIPATVTPTGSFAADLPKPATGDYRVLAKACFGPQSCGTGSANFTV
ncbi:MAG TPA: hypothetical protein VGB51_01580 [Actinomycetota bacterium]